MASFFESFLMVVNQMSPFLLLGFLIAGVLHVFVPKRFYARYLSGSNRLAVVYAALLGVPLPLCSCGVIPTAIGLRNERASKGAVASFLIATPQTGIDSILATYSLMGLGFAVVRPVAAMVTGICGGLLVNRFVSDNTGCDSCNTTASAPAGNRLWRVLHYAYFQMIQDIGLRLIVGLLIAALISVAVPDEFFLRFAHQPILQMLAVLLIAVPMYICSTGSIPVAAALMMKGLSPGAAFVMLMAGPAVNMASILVVRKSLGTRFTLIYLLTIIGFAVLFGLIINGIGIGDNILAPATTCCPGAIHSPSVFRIICSAVLVLFIFNALIMKFFSRFKHEAAVTGTTVYKIEGMHCNHCKAAMEDSALKIKGITAAEANPATGTLTVTGSATDSDIRRAVEKAGFKYVGIKQ